MRGMTQHSNKPISYVIFDMFETLVTLYEHPQYFGTQIAQDAGIPIEQFQTLWDGTEEDRTLGKITLEELVENILRQTNCYSTSLFESIIHKRKQSKKLCFTSVRSDILEMLSNLKKAGCGIGLVSNCFSEEDQIIRESVLYPYFDAPVLSYSVGLAKPDLNIFKLCVEQLTQGKQTSMSEFLYIGDGGSMELETANSIGMQTGQALWFLKSGTRQPTGRKPEFMGFQTPDEVVEYVNNSRLNP